MNEQLTRTYLSQRRLLIWRLLQIVRDPDIAEDLAQETYLRASRAMDEGMVTHLEAFLHKTARNLAIDYLRKRKSRGEYVEEDFDDASLANVASNHLTAEEITLEKERFQAFRQAMEDLPRRVQTVLVLSRIEGLSQSEIARQLGITERTVFSDLKQALAHCRDSLAKLKL